MRSASLIVLAAGVAWSTAACTRTSEPDKQANVAAVSTVPPKAPAVAAPASAESGALPLVTVHKSPTCSCCVLWVDHLREAGFNVQVVDSEDLGPIKQSTGVPAEKAACHTARVGDYFVEGHVPAEDIKRLLAESPEARGLVLPGMPAGSPGMEMPDGTRQPYTVELVHHDGSTVEFAKH